MLSAKLLGQRALVNLIIDFLSGHARERLRKVPVFRSAAVYYLSCRVARFLSEHTYTRCTRTLLASIRAREVRAWRYTPIWPTEIAIRDSRYATREPMIHESAIVEPQRGWCGRRNRDSDTRAPTRCGRPNTAIPEPPHSDSRAPTWRGHFPSHTLRGSDFCHALYSI